MSSDNGLPPTPPDNMLGGNAQPGILEPDKEARTMAVLAHLLGIVSGFLGPLIIWLIKKDQYPYVDDQAKEALNFQITIMIAVAGLIVLSFVTCGFGAILFVALPVVEVVFGIIAAMKCNNGEYYRYPITIRLLK